MPTVPRGRAGAIAFFATRISKWTNLGPAIGLGSAQAQALADAIEDAKLASERNRALQSAARAAAKEARRKEKDLRRVGGRAIASIRAKAGSDEDPAVLTLAQLPATKDPRPTPAPSKPTNVRTSVDHEGAIVIAWDATRPRPHARAFTRIERMLDGSGWFELIGSSGTNEYRDGTVPMGTRCAAYRLTPVRGKLVGAAAETVVVRLGTRAA
jgi:hypothetical protein